MKAIIVKDTTVEHGIVVARGWRNAAATLTKIIHESHIRGWMKDIERQIRKGRAVGIADLICILGLAHRNKLTARQKELKMAVKGFVDKEYGITD